MRIVFGYDAHSLNEVGLIHADHVKSLIGLLWCAQRVLRGGSWNNNPQNTRAAKRNNNTAENRNNNNGFRAARTSSARVVTAFRSMVMQRACKGMSKANHDECRTRRTFWPIGDVRRFLAINARRPEEVK